VSEVAGGSKARRSSALPAVQEDAASQSNELHSTLGRPPKDDNGVVRVLYHSFLPLKAEPLASAHRGENRRRHVVARVAEARAGRADIDHDATRLVYREEGERDGEVGRSESQGRGAVRQRPRSRTPRRRSSKHKGGATIADASPTKRSIHLRNTSFQQVGAVSASRGNVKIRRRAQAFETARDCAVFRVRLIKHCVGASYQWILLHDVYPDSVCEHKKMLPDARNSGYWISLDCLQVSRVQEPASRGVTGAFRGCRRLRARAQFRGGEIL
jgi:hypothetical protein